MNKLYIGKVVGTHGIKGEIKILANQEVSEKAFKINNIIYFEDDNREYKISSVRVHKGNHLVLLDGFNNINDVLFLNKKKVYINREDVLSSEEYVLSDLIGFNVIYNDKEIGTIKDYDDGISYATFLVEGEKRFYLPNVSEYITNIDLTNKKVYTKNVEGLIIWK